MLSIGKLANGQEAYYLGKVAQGIEDYYAGDGEATGRWTGSGADWWQAAGEGGDAVMIARTNLQARDLNQLARQVIKTAGALGYKEIEAHGHYFSVGDLVVTRVNDHGAGVRNLQRWQVIDAGPAIRELRLRRLSDEHEVILEAAYLDEVTRHGQPSLQHGYAVTAHVAQGSTEQMRLYAVIGAEPVLAETGPTATARAGRIGHSRPGRDRCRRRGDQGGRPAQEPSRADPSLAAPGSGRRRPT